MYKRQGHKNAVLEVCWDYDGGEVISGGADKNVIVWDAAVIVGYFSMMG